MTATPRIDWLELEAAFDFQDPSRRSYLDRRTGKVLTWSDLDEDAGRTTAAEAVDDDPERYLELEAIEGGQEHRWMSDFAATVADPHLRELLEVALRGRGAFRRFKDVLLGHPAERERWFALRGERVRDVVVRWLDEHGLTASIPETRRP